MVTCQSIFPSPTVCARLCAWSHPLQHDAQVCKRRWRWSVYKVPYGWQSLQSTAPTSSLQGPGEDDQGSSLRGRCWPCRPHRASSAAYHILPCGRLAAVWPWRYPKNRGSSQDYLPKRVPTTPRHHWPRRTEINTTVYLPRLHHLIWCKDQQRNWQQTIKRKLFIW